MAAELGHQAAGRAIPQPPANQLFERRAGACYSSVERLGLGSRTSAASSSVMSLICACFCAIFASHSAMLFRHRLGRFGPVMSFCQAVRAPFASCLLLSPGSGGCQLSLPASCRDATGRECGGCRRSAPGEFARRRCRTECCNAADGRRPSRSDCRSRLSTRRRRGPFPCTAPTSCAISFSVSTCLPFRIAAMAIGWCMKSGRAMITASTFGSSSSSL